MRIEPIRALNIDGAGGYTLKLRLKLLVESLCVKVTSIQLIPISMCINSALLGRRRSSLWASVGLLSPKNTIGKGISPTDSVVMGPGY